MKPKPAKPRPGRRVLILLSMMFLGSVLLRLADGSGQAIARQVQSMAVGGEAADHPGDGICGSDTDISTALVVLRRRAEDLDERESQLAERLQTLRVAEEEIEHNLAALTQAEDALRSTIAMADGAAESDIGKLTAVYQAMKPKEAAELFETMDPTFAAGFLARMEPDSAAPILAGLTPRAAYAISAILAGRNTGVPKE